jgi:uridine kinase
VAAPVYHFPTHTRSEETQHIPAADLIVAEGIFTLVHPALLPQYDLTVFVDTPLDTCLQRRIDRDRQERGRDEASVRAFWFERVLPMFEAFGGIAKAKATLIIDGTEPPEWGVRAIHNALQERVSNA